jgi:hypothetical protein
MWGSLGSDRDMYDKTPIEQKLDKKNLGIYDGNPGPFIIKGDLHIRSANSSFLTGTAQLELPFRYYLFLCFIHGVPVMSTSPEV